MSFISKQGDGACEVDIPVTVPEQGQGSPSVRDELFLYGIMFIYGLSLLFSWNALLLSYQYFTNRLSGWQGNAYILDYLLLIFFTVRLSFLFVVPYLLGFVSNYFLIRVSQSGLCLAFVLMGLLAMFHASFSDAAFIALLVVLVLCSAIFSVVAYQSGLAICTQVPPKFTQALSAGQGSAGVISALMKLAAVLVSRGNNDVGRDSVIYFWMTSASSLLALLLFFPVERILTKWKDPVSISSQSSPAIEKTEKDLSYKNDKEVTTEDSAAAPQESTVKRYYKIYRGAASGFWYIFLTMFQYIFIVPAFVNMTRSTQVGYYGDADSFYSRKIFIVVVFLIMGVGDFLGRMILKLQVAQIQNRFLHPGLIILRFVMIPFILLGNLWFEDQADVYPLPRPFANDGLAIALLTIYAFTGGYSITHLLMFVPRKAPSNSKKEASLIGVVFMGFGMLFGVILALIYKVILRNAPGPIS